MPSLHKQAEQVLGSLPIRPSNGNVLDVIHHKVLKGSPARDCLQVVQYLIETKRVRYKGSPKRPQALWAAKK